MSDTPLPRSQFPVVYSHLSMNHAGTAPLPVAAAEVMRRAIDDFVTQGGPAFDHWDDHTQRVRQAAARLLGVSAVDVAFVKNTTEGLGFVANGLDLQPGDRVIVPDLEFPSTIYPWLALRERGVVVDLIEPVGDGRTLPLERFAELLAKGPTAVVAVSWVQFGRGWRTDLAALADLCHRHGALLCADVIQGLGVIPCELAAWGVDFAMADSHKWLLGPLGVGVLYVAPGQRDRLRPLEPGWASVAHREQWDNLELVWDDSARRFEGGSANVITIAGMGASIDLLIEAGAEAVWSHVDGLCDRLCDGLEGVGATVLSDRSPDGRSSIVTFSVTGWEGDALWERLDLRGVLCAPRGGGVRLAPHAYNTDGEIDRVVELVGSLVTAPAH